MRLTETPRVSVLVATRNRPDDLARLIPTLLAQDETCFEVIIVDQSTDQRTADVVRGLGDPRIEYIHQTVSGKSKALNLGIRRCRAELIAFTDDDCTLPADWLSKGIQWFERTPGVGLVFGSLLPIDHDPLTQYVPSIHFKSVRRISGRGWRSHGLIGMGANMFAHHALFKAAGGFDEDLGPGGVLRTGEECELAFRALRAGFSVLQVDRPTATHWGARPWEDGIAAKLITDGFFAFGAGYGKHIARCDAHAACAAVHDSGRWFLELVVAVVRLKRPFHLRRIGSYWKGILVGLPMGPNVPRVSE